MPRAKTRYIDWSAIADLARPDFRAVIRQRGAVYHRSGRVTLRMVDAPGWLDAMVRGGRGYQVTIVARAAEQAVVTSCSCPHAVHSPCKHIWAALLEAATQFPDARIGDVRLHRFEATGDDDDGWGEYEEYGEYEDEDEDGHEDEDEDGDGDGDGEWSPVVEIPSGLGSSWRTQFQRRQPPPQTSATDLPSQPPAPECPPLADVGGVDPIPIFIVHATPPRPDDSIVISVATYCEDVDGAMGLLGPGIFMPTFHLHRLQNETDRILLATGLGYATGDDPHGMYPGQFRLPQYAADEFLQRAAAAGRLAHVLDEPSDRELPQGAWDLQPDPGTTWSVDLSCEIIDGGIAIRPSVFRTNGDATPDHIDLATDGGLVITDSGLGQLENVADLPWIRAAILKPDIRIPFSQLQDFLAILDGETGLTKPDLTVLESMQSSTDRPVARLQIRDFARRDPFAATSLVVRLTCTYGTTEVDVPLQVPSSGTVFDQTTQTFHARDVAFEAHLADLLREASATLSRDHWHRRSWPQDAVVHDVPGRSLRRVLPRLIEAGVQVDHNSVTIHNVTAGSPRVRSGVDWFDLDAPFQSDGEATLELPELLRAMRSQSRREDLILPDGSMVFVAPNVRRMLTQLDDLGTLNDGAFRFQPNQAIVLDAILESLENVDRDAVFSKRCAGFLESVKVRQLAASKSFQGTMRPYQEDGLGWLEAMRQTGFGGILADDMGLGKTVQVLALLQRVREQSKKQAAARRREAAKKKTKKKTKRTKQASGDSAPPLPRPSLIVVPASIATNWADEAARFTPDAVVWNHTGPKRWELAPDFNDVDIVITTYATMRRDITQLVQQEFAYAILDEAQSIKNPRTAAAKAACRLVARHRLAMSGTPVENHLGDLWSIFEFINPGMLGSGRLFNSGSGNSKSLLAPDDATLQRLANGLRPFILRRTKEQVAPELPKKLEQTLVVDLLPKERRAYDELKKYFRDSLTERIKEKGLARSKIHVLEALLRLRQAACHPGLMDKDRAEEPSAKTTLLLEQLRDVVAEGHKALVFSQFTTLLSIVRTQLDAEGITYQYLDGRTRKRAECVAAFQDDPNCPLFLISLKAGGVGLNLTAADYVFLLDPWWNPAVEAQAIDRTHRIGQTRNVFAYRIIARDTVEQKVLELQSRKRDLADAIISADASIIRTITREDLMQLLA